MKLKELLKDIHKNNVLGATVANVQVVEFQKRGLPHVHMLIMLKDDHKLRDKDDIDKYVCAEIPDAAQNPRLFEIVTKCMIHGPCGPLNPQSPCMENGECTKDFPKHFAEETTYNVDGYPKYRRRDNGVTATIGSNKVDNRWVVPYNKWLSLKYNAHINLEVCSSVKSVKYLFKYVYKGHDCANIKLSTTGPTDNKLNWDEINTFLDTRYISAPEAMWRINEVPLHHSASSTLA